MTAAASIALIVELVIAGTEKEPTNAVLAIVGVTVFAWWAFAVMFFSDVFGSGLSGYAAPVFMAVVSVCTVTASLPFTLKINAVEREQKLILESAPEYELNLAVYRKYESFSGFKGKTLVFALVIALATGFALAALFPDELWSLACVLVLVAGLAINNYFVKTLRKEVIPLEREIDEKQSRNKIS